MTEHEASAKREAKFFLWLARKGGLGDLAEEAERLIRDLVEIGETDPEDAVNEAFWAVDERCRAGGISKGEADQRIWLLVACAILNYEVDFNRIMRKVSDGKMGWDPVAWEPQP